MLSCPIASQSFQPIGWWRGQIKQCLRVVQLPQLALRDPLQIRPQPSGEASVEQRLGIPIGERTDHA